MEMRKIENKVEVKTEVNVWDLYKHIIDSYNGMESVRGEVYTLDNISMEEIKEIVPIKIELSDIIELISKKEIAYKDAIIVVENPDGPDTIENYITIVDMDGFKKYVLNQLTFTEEKDVIYETLKEEYGDNE